MIDRDLFAIFPDLPRPHIRRPRIQKLARLPKPAASRLHDRRRTGREPESDALRRISIIAHQERRRVGLTTPRGRALTRIIAIASPGPA
jgi:hypothetical protein